MNGAGDPRIDPRLCTVDDISPEDFEKYVGWLRAAYEISLKSPRPDNHNGAVLISDSGAVLGQAYNIPRPALQYADRKALYDSHPDWCPTAPCAEARVLDAVMNNFVDTGGATLVSLWQPCASICLKRARAAGLREVVFLNDPVHGPTLPQHFPDLSDHSKADILAGWDALQKMVVQGAVENIVRLDINCVWPLIKKL